MDKTENLNNILTSFKVDAKCISYQKIRNISLYDLKLEPGTRIKDLDKFSNEIALAMLARAAPIIRLIPELGIVRLEVVDDDPQKISFFSEAKLIKNMTGSVPMYLGSSVNGENIVVDFAKNPHLLIAGCTGSGKSTLLHLIIANALGLPDAKIYLIDTKNIEYCEYSKLDKKISIANSYEEALNMLDFLYSEMEFRFSIIRDKSLSVKFFGTSQKDFPQILFIIDEFADLIMQDRDKVLYKSFCRLTQKCRAAGIYCVCATQRPSVDVLSGSIKANFPARISCQVASSIDSKVILDVSGAERLSGNGDAIIKNYNYNYKRFQAAYTTAEEVCACYVK
jgi:DNA segregation ATPase FtsK/SpoIIIE, S-DNA-T family